VKRGKTKKKGERGKGVNRRDREGEDQEEVTLR
jgi:hypothetical protein